MKLCNHCQGEHNKKQKYCSNKCRWRAKDIRKSIEIKDSIKDKGCKECKIIFTPTCNHPKYQFCSLTCKDKNNKRRYAIEGRTKLWQRPSKERIRELHRKYYHDETTGRKAQVIEANARRRALQRKSSIIDSELTSFVYNEAKVLCKEREATTQTQWHVDHVVPIKGKDVCGLHVWYNFSVIPKIENLKKGNKTCLL